MIASVATLPGFVTRLFFVTTREERTEVFFGFFCALSVFFDETLLLAFFDGNTDNLHRWGGAVIWVTRRNGHEHIQSFHNLTKDAVLVV